MKKYQRKLPEKPYPTGVRFIPVPVPDDDLWAATFAGNCYETLRQQHYWERDPSGDDAKEVAEKWQEVYNIFITEYLAEIETMSCEDVNDCIENTTEIQQTIINIINEINNTTNNFPIYNVPYQPLPEQNYTQNQILEIETEPSSCTDEATFGAALEVVQWVADDIQTFFDLVEIADDPAEVMSIITGAIGLPPASILTAFFDLITFMSDISPQLWDFSNNETTQNRLACAIWCNWRDCNSINLETVYETVAFEFDTVTGRNISSLSDLISIIDEIANGNLIDYGLFTGFIAAWGAFIRFIQRTPFGSGFKTPTDWKNIMRVGYINGDAGYINCDPCAGTEPCGFYVVNFTTLAVAGLPVNWMPNPPANLSADPNFANLRWANTRGSNQTLRAANYPSYGLQDDDFSRLCAAYDLQEGCELLNLTTDFNYAATSNTKQVSAFGLYEDYDWDNRVLIDTASVVAPDNNEPGIAWSGNLPGIRYVLLTSNGIYKAGSGTTTLRFFRVNV